MKKIFSFLLTVATTLAITTSCADIPMPYDIFANGDVSFGKKLPYKNASLSAFSTFDKKEGLPAWSIGANYTQATGYQKWDGAADKSNKEVESYLISPALNTTCASGKVRVSFDQTIRYENKVTGWQNYHKVFISKDYTGNTADFDKATWTPLAYTPKASTTNDWTLYTSGQIPVPEDFVNHDSVYVAFYFYAPAANSTTWELMNFLIEEGEAVADTTATPTAGQKLEEALTVSEARALIAAGSGLDAKYYVKGKVNYIKEIDTSNYGNATYSISDETDTLIVYRGFGLGAAKFTTETAIKVGDEVIVYGQLTNYMGNTPEFTQGSQLVSHNGTIKDVEKEKEDPNAEVKGTGTLEDPFNIAGIIAEAKKLDKGATSATDVYFKGKVVSLKDVSASFGNATFYVSDDGTTTNQFYVYRALGLGNKNVTDEKFIKVGDEVVICGKITNYNGTLETAQKSAYVYSVNGSTEGGNTTGGDDSGNTGTESEITLANANFEAWTDDATPEGWKSTNTASNATLAKSTDAHGGSFSVSVTAVEDKNMRLASKEIALKAGTYTFSYYAKGTKADKTQTRGGHAYPDGTSVKYTYNSSFTDLNNETWTLVSYEFTLSENTTINLVVMNPKKSSYVTSQDILVDDAKLTTKNGGLAE
ncbi:MAG: carbohydrate binding domain-containing protein [Bacteroidaceae bacterium]|nr:carbohydrate binding domain-containing protein [Bacteroidaceae bacterium]